VLNVHAFLFNIIKDFNMAKKGIVENQTSDINELSKLVNEFVDRYTTVENEISLLKEDQKTLVDEFSDKLDIKTLKQAIRAINIKKKVEHQDTFDTFVDILDSRIGD